jgi:hypothetical protein
MTAKVQTTKKVICQMVKKNYATKGRNVLMDAPKGTKVLTHEQQLFEMMQSKGISMSANYTKANGMTAQEMDGVLAKHFIKYKPT